MVLATRFIPSRFANSAGARLSTGVRFPNLTLTAWNVQTRQRLWRVEWQQDEDPTQTLNRPEPFSTSLPLADGEQAFLVGERSASGSKLQARRLSNGELIWEYQISKDNLYSDNTSSPIAAVVTQGASQAVAILDFDPQSVSWKLVLLSGESGRQLDTHLVPYLSKSVNNPRGIAETGTTSLTLLDADEGGTTLALICPRQHASGSPLVSCELLDVVKGKFQSRNVFRYEDGKRPVSDEELPSVTQFHLVRQSDGQLARIGIRDSLVFAHVIDQPKLLWKYEVPDRDRLLISRKVSGSSGARFRRMNLFHCLAIANHQTHVPVGQADELAPPKLTQLLTPDWTRIEAASWQP